MNARPSFLGEALTLFSGVCLAALVQTAAPPLTALSVKIPALLALAVYYAMRRGPAVSACAAAWCGVAAGGASATVPGLELLIFAAAWGLCRAVFRKQMPDGNLSCIAVASVLAPAAAATEYAAMRLCGIDPGVPPLFLAARVAAYVPAGAAATSVFAPLLRALDLMSANVGRKEEDDDAFGEVSV